MLTPPTPQIKPYQVIAFWPEARSFAFLMRPTNWRNTAFAFAHYLIRVGVCHGVRRHCCIVCRCIYATSWPGGAHVMCLGSSAPPPSAACLSVEDSGETRLAVNVPSNSMSRSFSYARRRWRLRCWVQLDRPRSHPNTAAAAAETQTRTHDTPTAGSPRGVWDERDGMDSTLHVVRLWHVWIFH